MRRSTDVNDDSWARIRASTPPRSASGPDVSAADRSSAGSVVVDLARGIRRSAALLANSRRDRSGLKFTCQYWFEIVHGKLNRPAIPRPARLVTVIPVRRRGGWRTSFTRLTVATIQKGDVVGRSEIPAGDRIRYPLSQAMAETITRRDFGRLVVGTAGAAALAPAVATAAGSPARLPRALTAVQGGKGGTVAVARSGDADTLDPQHTIYGYSLE